MTDHDDQGLEDFDSPELERVAASDHSYLSSMWSQYSFRSRSQNTSHRTAEDTVVAHGMVQAFVNAFARDGHYAVSFDENVSTAGTDLEARQVVITPAPIADPTLTAEQAGLILTGLAVHEITHSRYGRQTAQAVARVFPWNPVADRLSNLLDDIRGEARYVADYPGYAGIFQPVLDYVGAAAVKRNLGKLLTQKVSEPVNLAIAATRYPAFSAWTPETSAEADWWVDWAARGSREDAPKRHVDFIREALRHIADLQAPKPAPKSAGQESSQGGTGTGKPSGEQGESSARDDAQAPESDGAGEGDANDEPAQEAAPEAAAPRPSDDMDDFELNKATKAAAQGEPDQTPSCPGGKTLDKAAVDNGADRGDVKDLKDEAQQIVESARNIEDDGHGEQVDVARSLKGLSHNSTKPGPSAVASRYIRNAILRSRTGHTAVDSFQKRGRLDQKGLARVAHGDARVFERRTAPSPGKYNIWVMFDLSSSMAGSIDEEAQVAHAIATATQSTQTVRVTEWAWSAAFRPSPCYAGVARVWKTGENPDQVFKMTGLEQGGTPDATILGWATRSILSETRPDETPVIIVVSDGEGMNTMTDRVRAAREKGVVVKSVSFGGGFTAKKQEERFGRGNYVPWAGSITATARPLADLIAKITSGR